MSTNRFKKSKYLENTSHLVAAVTMKVSIF